jgi:hypothetical protein
MFEEHFNERYSSFEYTCDAGEPSHVSLAAIAKYVKKNRGDLSMVRSISVSCDPFNETQFSWLVIMADM